MRLTQKLAPLFVALVAALLVIPVVSKLHQNPVSANVQKQVQAPAQQSQSDAPAKTKQAKPQQPPAVGVTAPTNDNCASAVAVASLPFTDTTSNVGATTEASEPAPCGSIGATIWYSYTNTRPNPVDVSASTCTSPGTDTAIAAYKVTGAPCAFAGFVNVACNDDFCGGNGFQSQIGFTADVGATYKIQVGGFGGSTGSITLNITGVEQQPVVCPDIVVNGVMGSGSPDRPGFSGVITPSRLFRDGVASTCAVPKLTCPGTSGSGSFAFDAYPFTNASGQSQCVTVAFDPNPVGSPCGINAHAVVYLGNFNPANVCQFYLADVGSSATQSFSFTVPVGATFFVVINANVAGTGVGCNYKYTVRGNLCVQFDYCVQDDTNPRRFVLINSITGAYEAHDCSKGLTLSGTGGVATYFCKIELFDQGPNPKHPDRYVDVQVNPCTGVGDAAILFSGNLFVSLHDSNIHNNNCVCPMQPR